MFSTAVVNSGSFGKIYSSHIERLEQLGEVNFLNINSGSEIEIISKLKPYNAIIASTTPYYTAEILKSLGNLKILARHGTGYNNVDLHAANELNIYVTRTPGTAAANGVAEYTLSLILGALRNLFYGYEYVKENRWKERGNLIGSELAGKKIGIIGYGNIGRRLSQLLAVFNVEILIYDHNILSDIIPGARQTDLQTLLKNSDIISLHCALNEQTRNLINADSLKLCQPNCMIVNAARGDLVDHLAVVEALTANLLGAYVADVVSDEPINNQHILVGVRNCFILPHLGGYSHEFLHAMGETCVNSIEAVANNNSPIASNLVTNC